MICNRCGQESPESTASCPACGSRQITREWTVSGWLLAVTASCLVLLGATATWVTVAPHQVTPTPLPETAIFPSAAKPSPAIAATADPPAQPPAEIFRHFAPPRISSPSLPAPAPATLPAPARPMAGPPAPAPVARSRPTPVAVPPAPVPTARPRAAPAAVAVSPAPAVIYPLGSVRDEIDANSRVIKHFTVPAGLSAAHYRTDVVRLEGSRRLHVWVVKDNRAVFDSGVCTESHINMDLPSGNYLLVVANAALMFPVTVDIRGQITGQRP